MPRCSEGRVGVRLALMLAGILSGCSGSGLDTQTVRLDGFPNDVSTFVPAFYEREIYLVQPDDPIGDGSQNTVSYKVDVTGGMVVPTERPVEIGQILRPPRYWSPEMPPEQRRLGTYPLPEPASAPLLNFCTEQGGRSIARAVVASEHLRRTIVVCQSAMGMFSWYISSTDGWRNLGRHGGPHPLATGLIIEVPDGPGASFFTHVNLVQNFAVRIDLTEDRLSEASIPGLDRIDLRISLGASTKPTNLMRVGNSIVTLVDARRLCVAYADREPECFDDILGAVADPRGHSLHALQQTPDGAVLLKINLP